uniref:C3H1-type domain-containing protein n=1 Tax=Meloidogyne floridensis TaxID=298350 RepID=A0A915NIH9_9BILA
MQPDSENLILQNSNILFPSKFSKGHVDTTEEDEKLQFLMQNHHELCDLSKCMGKRINGLFICQFSNIPGSQYSQYLRHRRRQNAYKTKPCRNYYGNGCCKAGNECTFYHAIGEMRTLPQMEMSDELEWHPIDVKDFFPQLLNVTNSQYNQHLRNLRRQNAYKTKPCRNYYGKGFCKAGNECSFYHAIGEMRVPPQHEISGKVKGYSIDVKDLFPQVFGEFHHDKENQAQFGSSAAMQLEMERIVDRLISSPFRSFELSS